MDNFSLPPPFLSYLQDHEQAILHLSPPPSKEGWKKERKRYGKHQNSTCHTLKMEGGAGGNGEWDPPPYSSLLE